MQQHHSWREKVYPRAVSWSYVVKMTVKLQIINLIDHNIWHYAKGYFQVWVHYFIVLCKIIIFIKKAFLGVFWSCVDTIMLSIFLAHSITTAKANGRPIEIVQTSSNTKITPLQALHRPGCFTIIHRTMISLKASQTVFLNLFLYFRVNGIF